MADQIITEPTAISRRHLRKIKALYGILWCLDHWMLILSIGMGTLVVVPFLAPIFMHWGWIKPAQIIYTIYSALCHQMAQRSFFLFGAQPMYNIAQLPIELTGKSVSDMLLLRAFIGNENLGWKVAWSDRMVYMYGGVWLAGIIYSLVKRRQQVRPLKPVYFVLLLLPMILDGVTHTFSDTLGGLTDGFRYGNQWLATLTGNRLPTWFYAGDAFGSFNSWMRFISGITFAIGVVWLAYPYINREISVAAAQLRWKLESAK
ncbi:MAG: DUF2085 domain-containing protein [Chloroflexi bacterium]|nr:DUF2085 domain-containing protein [Chloroflexota bacterium]